MTEIQYRNITPNRFTKLSLFLHVVAPDNEIDISDLFPPEMTMAGYDHRIKWFEPLSRINERGLFLNMVVQGQPPPLLTVGYSHEFLGKRETVEMGRYRWNPVTQIWEND